MWLRPAAQFSGLHTRKKKPAAGFFRSRALHPVVFWTVLFTFWTSGLRAQPCAQYEGRFHVDGLTKVPGRLYRVAADSGYACTNAEGGLFIIDISDPTSPRQVALTRDVQSNHGLAVRGRHAYVANEDLKIVDFTHPASPRVVSAFTVPGITLYEVALMGDFAVAAGYGGLAILDVSSPEFPLLVSRMSAGHLAGVAVRDAIAFVLDEYQARLDVFDLSDPISPRRIGTLGTARSIHAIALQGDLAFITDYYGLEIVDVSKPAAPRALSRIDTSAPAEFVAAMGGIAYVLDLKALNIVDVSNPASPRLAAKQYVGQYPRGLGASREVVCTVGLSGWVSTFSAGRGIPVAPIGTKSVDHRWICPSWPYVYMVEPNVFKVIDISTPQAPTTLVNLNLPHDTYAVAVERSTAYVGASSDYPSNPWDPPVRPLLYQIDIANPASPRIVGGWVLDDSDFGGWALDISVHDGHVLVADAFLGVLSFKDGAVHRIPLAANSVAFYHHLACITSGDLSLIRPTNPAVVLDSIQTPGDAKDVCVANDLAFVADGYSGLQVYDLSDSMHIRPFGGVAMPGFAMDVCVRGDRAYVATELGLRVVDIHEPDRPRLLGGSTEWVRHVATDEQSNFVFTSDAHTLALWPLDCSGSTDVGLADASAGAEDNGGIRIRWSAAPGAFTGFSVLRAAGARPGESDYWTIASVRSVAGDASYSYLDSAVASDADYCYEIVGSLVGGGAARVGPLVVRSSSMGRTLALAVAPNPASSTMNLFFFGGATGEMRLRIFDVRGRLVRNLGREWPSPGRYAVTWDGRTNAGSACPTGIYFARLSRGGVHVSERLVKLK